MLKTIFSLLKYFAIYPAIVGGAAYNYFISTPFNYSQGTDFFFVSIFKNMIPFNGLSDSFYYFVTFYMLGYTYGIVSSFYGVRKFKKGLLLSILIWITKITGVMFIAPLSPIIMIAHLVTLIVNFIKNKQPQQSIPATSNSRI